MKHLICLLFIFCHAAHAQCDITYEDCAPVGEWEFSIALGAGLLTNPLNGGKDIPLIVIPNFSYYGEKLFIDNNAIGYTLYENYTISFSAVSQLNRENSFFNRWHPSNIFINTLTKTIVLESLIDSESTDITEVELDDIEERKWAIDAGVQLNWFFNRHNQLKVLFLHNINNVYNGYNGQIEFDHLFIVNFIPNNIFALTAGVNWQSKKQVDYYYGIDAQDNVPAELYYQGSAAFNPYLKLNSHYVINQDWSFKLILKREWLGSSVKNSPLVKDGVIDTLFIGVEYAF
ncbi:MAG: MipA/OmpV family protein [Colwellia sp.]|nr:MipA/OmpV family protein [Colwellia sp.]